MPGRHGLDAIEPLRSGQQIEHRTGIRVVHILADALLLHRGKTLVGMPVGWLLRWSLWCSDFQLAISANQPPDFLATLNGWP